MEQTKYSKASPSIIQQQQQYSNYISTGDVGNNAILASGAPNTNRNQPLLHPPYFSSSTRVYPTPVTRPLHHTTPHISTHPSSLQTFAGDWNVTPSTQQRDSYNNGGNVSVYPNNSPFQQPNSSNKNPSQQHQQQRNNNVSPPPHNQWKHGSTNTTSQYSSAGGSTGGSSRDYAPTSPNYQIAQQAPMNLPIGSGDYRFPTQQQQTNNIQSNPSVVHQHQHYNQPPPQQFVPMQTHNIQNYHRSSSVFNSGRGNNNTSAVENSRGGYQTDQTKVGSQSSLMATPQSVPRLARRDESYQLDATKQGLTKIMSHRLAQQQQAQQQQQFNQFNTPSTFHLPPHPSTTAHLQTCDQRGDYISCGADIIPIMRPPNKYNYKMPQMCNPNPSNGGGAPIHRQHTAAATFSHDPDIMVHGSFGTWNPIENDRIRARNYNNSISTPTYPNMDPYNNRMKYCSNNRQIKGTRRLWEAATAYEKKEKQQQQQQQEKQNQMYNNIKNNQQQRRNNNVTNKTSTSVKTTYNSSSSSNNQQAATTKLEKKIQAMQSSKDEESGGDQNGGEDEMKFESWLESANFKWETKVVSERSSQQQKKFITIARLEGSDNSTTIGNGEGANETESRRAACKSIYIILDRDVRIDRLIQNNRELLKKSPPVKSSSTPATTATEDNSKNQKAATDETESSKSQTGRSDNNATADTSNNHPTYSMQQRAETLKAMKQQQSGKSKIPSLLSLVVPRPTVPHPPHYFPPNNDYHHYGGGGHGEPSWSSRFHHWRHPGNYGFGPHYNMDHHHHQPHPVPRYSNAPPYRDRGGNGGGSTPVVPWYVYPPHHHHGNHHHHHHVGGPPHHHRGGGHHGPSSGGPPPPPNDVWDMMRMREMEQNWYEDQLHQESESLHPEDVFINRMIMNQKEATRCVAGLPPPRSPRMNADILPRDWNHPAPANKAKQTLDDKHVLAKHAAIYPHPDELKSVNEVVILTEKILKALSDQFVNEDHPLPKDNVDDEEEDEELAATSENNQQQQVTTTGGADGEQANSKPPPESVPTSSTAGNEKSAVVNSVGGKEETGGEFGGGETTSSNIPEFLNQKEETTTKSAEKKPKFQILKRPKRKPKKVPDTRPRVLCGVNRVGALAKGLLIHGDDHVEMVLLCGSIPTKQLLARVLKHFPEQMKESRADFDYVIEHEDAGFSIVAKLTFTVKVSVTLTSVSLKPKDKKSTTTTSVMADNRAAEVTSAEVTVTSEDNKPNEDEDDDDNDYSDVNQARIREENMSTDLLDLIAYERWMSQPDLVTLSQPIVAIKKVDEDDDDDDVVDEKLNREKEVEKITEENDDDDVTTEFPEDMLPVACQLEALSKLRHAKWFLGRASSQDSCVVIIRILRNMQVRVPLWAPLSCWALENLIYLSLSSSNEHMSPGDAFRRVFEVIAGGILLPDGPGILDPCEKIPVDVLDCCSDQQLEEITRNAQKALSLITFRGIHQVLGMAKITAHHNRHVLNNNNVGGGRSLSGGVRSVVTKPQQQQANESITGEEDDLDHPDPNRRFNPDPDLDQLFESADISDQVVENNAQEFDNEDIDSVHEDDDGSNEVEDSIIGTSSTTTEAIIENATNSSSSNYEYFQRPMIHDRDHDKAKWREYKQNMMDRVIGMRREIERRHTEESEAHAKLLLTKYE